MLLSGEFIFLTVEEKPGMKDPTKIYKNISLLQGADPVKFPMSDSVADSLKKGSVPAFTNCRVDMDVNFQYQYNPCRVVAIYPIK